MGRRFRQGISGILLLALCFLAACSGENRKAGSARIQARPPVFAGAPAGGGGTAKSDRYTAGGLFILRTGAGDILIDRDGTELLRGVRLEILDDRVTKAPICVTDQRITGGTDGNLVFQQAVYSPDGRLVRDWDSVRYIQLTGTVIYGIRLEYEADSEFFGSHFREVEGSGFLFDVKQQRTVCKMKGYPSVWTTDRLIVDVYSPDHNWQRRDVTDLSGKVLYTFPEELLGRALPWNDLLLVFRERQDRSSFIMNKDFEIIQSGTIWAPVTEEMTSGYRYTSAVTFVDDRPVDCTGAYTDERTADWWWAYQLNIPGVSFQGWKGHYADHEIAVVGRNGQEGSYALCRRAEEGTPAKLITEWYGVFVPLVGDDQQADCFFTVKNKTLYVLNRDGEVVDSDDSRIYTSVFGAPGGEGIICSYFLPEVNDAENGRYRPEGMLLMDKTLSVQKELPLSPASRWSRDGGYWAGFESGVGVRNPDWPFVIEVSKKVDRDYSYTLADLYDFDLNLIIDNVSQVQYYGRDRLLVTRGFSAGMIDYEGNWLYKTGAFQTVGD